MNTQSCWLLLLCWLGTLSLLFGQSDPFLRDFLPKNAVVPASIDVQKPTTPVTTTVTINPLDTLNPVSEYLYGNNANVWMGQMVSDTILINRIKLLSPHILRFPGGNLSNNFFWNAPNGQPPSDVPDSLYDTNGAKTPAGYWYGRNTAAYTVSVDNFYSMLAMTGNTGMITVNYSYARYGTGPNPVATAAHLAADWVRYDNGRTKFWEIGNENGGIWQAGYEIDTTVNKDGQPQIISGILYGRHFLIFADSMRAAAAEGGRTIALGAQLIEHNASNEAEPNRSWNDGVLRVAGNNADFFIVHSYYTPYNENSSAAVVLNSAFGTSAMIRYVNQLATAYGVGTKPVALTEWNIFAVGSKQMVSFVNGMHAAAVLGELATYGYSMASRWDLANGYDTGNDHGIFNIGDEPGVPKWNPRPAFFTMHFFQHFFGDHVLLSSVTGSGRIPAVHVYASVFNSGHLGVVLLNTGTGDETVKINTGHYVPDDRYYVYSLTGGNDNGEFSPSVYINGSGPTNATGGPIDSLSSIAAWAYPAQGGIVVPSPARSIQYVLLKPGGYTFVDKSADPRTPSGFSMSQNFPNPFNPSTTIRFGVPTESRVRLRVFNVLGQVVAELANEDMQAGYFVRAWNANVPSGTYLCRIEATSIADPNRRYMDVKKMILLK